MTFTWHILVILIPPLLILEGFFSGSEIALLTADRLELKKKSDSGSAGAKLALALAKNPERVLSTTLLITSLCMIGVSALGTFYFMGMGHRHAELMSILMSSPLVVIFGELIPKTIFQRFSDRIAPWVSTPIYYIYYVFYPMTRPLSFYTRGVSKIAGPVEDLMIGKRRTTRDEVQMAIDSVEGDSKIHATERKMIKRIFHFREKEARHALIPLVQVEAIDRESSARDALERFQKNRHSRMPVFQGRIDNIVGILEVTDLLGIPDLSVPLRNYISPVRYAPENQSLEALMLDMRTDDAEMTVIVDEYGGAVGILTFEDIVEEIVGEINDEYDSAIPSWKETSPNTWIVLAKTEILAINEALKIELPEGDYETLAGFLLQQFGCIPDVRDELYFTTRTGTYRFTIRKASERMIEQVRVERVEERESNS